MTTSSVEAAHVPLEMVHLRVAELLVTVTVDVGLVAELILAVPETTLQTPEPMVAVFAANVAVVPQIVWSDPALATVGDL